MVMAVRRVHYLVEAPQGQTQYKTREIQRSACGIGGRSEVQSWPTHIEFDFNRAEPRQESMPDLNVFGNAMVACLRAGKTFKVVLEGHTDNIGTPAYNMALSMGRASASRKYLMARFGLPESLLQIGGKGATNPIATNKTAEGRSRNRRVNFDFESLSHPGQ
jgi:outer membrane protein OmpA-like peptidoglycan-associated protein